MMFEYMIFKRAQYNFISRPKLDLEPPEDNLYFFSSTLLGNVKLGHSCILRLKMPANLKAESS